MFIAGGQDAPTMGASEKGEGKEAKGPPKATGLQGAPSARLLAALLRTA